MIEEALWALSQILNVESLMLLVIAAVIGSLMGALPGLGSAITLALLIPFSFSLGTTNGLLFLIGALGGVNYGGSIPSILLNIPGQGPSVITTIDGFPMSKDGRAAEALGASATASALGALCGVVFLIAAIPLFKRIMRLIGPPEFMLVAVIGMGTIAYVIQGSVINGLIGVGLGIILGFHGFDAITGSLRFDFGLLYLYDGVPLIIVVLGLFAVAEMIDLGVKNQTIAEDPDEIHGSPLPGIRETIRQWRLVVKSSVTGIVIGFIPAAGSTVATLIAYARAKAAESKSDTATFGQGDIRGVIAPEAANDSKDGGALLPTIAFAIPGTAAHAVLLGGLLLHGITPGPTVFNEDLPLLFVLIFGLLISNFVTSIIGLALIKQYVKITKVPTDILIPIIIVISMFGSYAYRNNPADIVAVFVLGLLGFGALLFGISRIALLFGIILGPIIEKTFHQTLQIAQGDIFVLLSRPVFSTILVGLFVSIVVLSVSRKRETLS